MKAKEYILNHKTLLLPWEVKSFPGYETISVYESQLNWS